MGTPTNSVNLTEQQAVKKMKLIHQRKTRTNMSMPESIEEEEDEIMEVDNAAAEKTNRQRQE